MLLELRVSQLALVDEVMLRLQPGMTVLTGETGAGKSLIAGAFSLLCGKSGDKDLIRHGEELAYVEGVFDLSDKRETRDELSRAGIRISSDGILVLRRELRRQGRSRVLINGLVSSLALLERIGPLLLAVQSQDQQRELDSSTYARRFLDSQLDCEELLTEMKECWREFRIRRDAFSERRREELLAAEQLDLWKYQHDELNKANLRLGEEEELTESLTLLRHATALQAGAAKTWEFLSGGEAASKARIGECLAILKPLTDKSHKLAAIYKTLLSAEEAIADAAVELNRFLDGLELDPANLDEMESRKALYDELQRKYNLDTENLIRQEQILAGRIARQEEATADLRDLGKKLAIAQHKLESCSESLHLKRVEGATSVAAAVTTRIRPLALPALELEFRVTLREDPNSPVRIAGKPCRINADGGDEVELLVRTNPGERMGPVGQIASGGERSRIHLGLSVQYQRRPSRPLMLFDEIDTGLGMDAAVPVATLLHELSLLGQVVCITHLPTIAVYGNQHLFVTKEVQAGRTLATVRQLPESERITEIARLLGGEGWGRGDWDSQRSYAQDLLKTGKLTRSAESGE